MGLGEALTAPQLHQGSGGAPTDWEGKGQESTQEKKARQDQGILCTVGVQRALKQGHSRFRGGSASLSGAWGLTKPCWHSRSRGSANPSAA